ncbi:MAG: DNA translocase FtsK [Bacillota bacterium]|nr:DNA translocase FtsK [Bacillota bacterium]
MISPVSVYGQPKREVRYEILGLVLAALAALAFLSLYAGAGAVGNIVARACRALAGEGAALIPLLLGYWGFTLIKDRHPVRFVPRLYGGLLCLGVILATVQMALLPEDEDFSLVAQTGLAGDGGGVLGAVLGWVLYRCFGYAGSVVVLVSAGLVGITLFTELPLMVSIKGLWQRLWRGTLRAGSAVGRFVCPEVKDEEPGSAPVIIDAGTRQDGDAGAPEAPAPAETRAETRVSQADRRQSQQISLGDVTTYQLPPLSLLVRPRVKAPKPSKDIAENIRVLEETLESFGVRAKVLQVSRGPAITRYEVQPAAGVKVSRIVSLSDDIALSMAAPGVRIEAPIPGKAAVGIEVPNREVTMVHLRDLLESKEFVQSPSRLTVALGKDIAGTPVIADLALMPHLLIAGATGAGKSVCLNTIIASVLFKSQPDEVKLLMIDPKMVELTTYNGIPHLISPVVTDPKKAAVSLKWLVREMERRYELFAATGVRDITRYNSVFKTHDLREGDPAHLPLIVVVIDELADLMMVAPNDVEDAICRLAQMARAAGIHLVVATQRPSVDVITGLIKANIPSRISFAVSSQTDSRTILDIGGAEKLLGKGDMLFLPVGASKPVRVQGAFLSDRDVEALVGFLKKQAMPDYDEEIFEATPEEEERFEEDELFPKAVEIVVRSGLASISLLQRRLHIGYSRAARLIDMMERRGIVGGFEGSKPRTVLMSPEQYNLTFAQRKKKA